MYSKYSTYYCSLLQARHVYSDNTTVQDDMTFITEFREKPSWIFSTDYFVPRVDPVDVHVVVKQEPGSPNTAENQCTTKPTTSQHPSEVQSPPLERGAMGPVSTSTPSTSKRSYQDMGDVADFGIQRQYSVSGSEDLPSIHGQSQVKVKRCA